MSDITEAEAATKWCPASRMLSHTSAQDGKGRMWEGGYSYNRSADGGELYIPTGCKCIGSACMMWRQGQKRNPEWMPNHSMMAGYEMHPDDRQPTHIPDPERGHCALASS